MFSSAARAQETESAASSNIVGVQLPAGAQRVLPGSVPAEVGQMMDKFITASEGKLRKGETEVLVWGGSNYQKSNAGAIVNRLTATLKSAGWNYSAEGQENGVTVFSVIKEGANRRAVLGFHGATDDALVWSWMEVLSDQGNGSVNRIEADSQNYQTETAPVRSSNGGGIVGTWTNGSTSMLGEKNMTTGVVTSRSGSTFKYVFTADGRFEFIGLINSTMYGCTTSLFNDKRGRYQINGSQITLIPSKNFWRNTYSCSPASNKERDYVLDRETYDYRTKQDEYGKTLVCLANEKGESCYRREE